MARLVVFCIGLTVLSQCFLFIQCTDKIFITDVGDGKIFMGENSGFDFHGEDIREISLSGVGAPTGIDYDYRTDKIYWSDESARTINRASLDGSNQEILIGPGQGIGTPLGIVLDVISSRIFWTDTGLDRISSASVLGSNRRIIISTGLYRPWGITLSQKRGKLYWTDEGVSTGKIEMSNKDGSDRRELVTRRLRKPNSLALDSQEQRLYWTESYYDVIESTDLDDLSDRREHINAESGDLVVFGISLYFTSIYFTDFASRGLYEADIGAEEIREITGFTAGVPTHVKIYADLMCTDSCPGNSRCQFVAYNTSECTCLVDWTGLNCLTRITCTLPNPPPMASFVNPRDSYTANTTVTVTCDNGNDKVEWICNGYTGNWDKEPIDCSTQSSGITCTLPNPPPMASFVNPSDSYTTNTAVTVTCDNGNDKVKWICNGYTGNWDKGPIDCSTQSSGGHTEGRSIETIATVCGTVIAFMAWIVSLFVCYKQFWAGQRSADVGQRNVDEASNSAAAARDTDIPLISQAGLKPARDLSLNQES